MDALFTKAIDRFRSKVKLLIADDDLHILSSMGRNFVSPALSLTLINNYKEVIEVIQHSNSGWHCWILDIDLGDNHTGIEVMKSNPKFPFIVILSGLQSMSIAAEAVNQGALTVFDKSPDFIPNLFSETCKIAALGYLLGGKATQYLSTYLLLCKSVIKSPDEWAEKACLSLRQLQRICNIHPIESPRATLSLYYTLYTLLLKGKPPFSSSLPQAINPDHADYIAECIDYTMKKND